MRVRQTARASRSLPLFSQYACFWHVQDKCADSRRRLVKLCKGKSVHSFLHVLQVSHLESPWTNNGCANMLILLFFLLLLFVLAATLQSD